MHRAADADAKGLRLSCLISLAILLVISTVLAGQDYPPLVPPPKPIVVPVPQVRRLANGLRVMAIERHSLPIVTLRLVIETGAEADPRDLPGTAEMTSSLLNEGTTRRSAREIAEAIDGAGGTVDAQAEWDESHLEVSVLTDHNDEAFDLLSDMAINAAFAPEEVERIRRQTISSLELLRDDAAYLADSVLAQVEMRGTPYDHPPDGTLDSIRRITPADLRQFYSAHYRPANAILAVVGDIAAEEAFRKTEEAFAGWKGTGESGALLPQFPSTSHSRESGNPEGGLQRESGEWTPASGGVTSRGSEAETDTAAQPSGPPRQVIIIDKPEAVQTEIRVGNPGVRRLSPEYYALVLANQVLGGPAANRLFKVLRTERGLTYNASSELTCHKAAGSWESKTSTRTAETVHSVQALLEQLKRLGEQPVTPNELENARDFLVGHMALEFESSEGLAAQMLELMVHDLPLDYWNHFPENIRGVDAGEVLSATRKYLVPDRAVIVLVGDAATFQKAVKKFGPVRVIPSRDVDLDSPNLLRTSAGARPR